MDVDEIKREEQRISRRREAYREAARPGTSMIGLGILMFFASPTILAVLTERLFGLNYWQGTPLFMGLSFIIIILGVIINRKRGAYLYSLKEEEELFLDVCLAMRKLNDYLEDKLEISRSTALKKINRVVKVISRWHDVTRSRSAPEILRSEYLEPLRTFKENLESRLVFAVRHGDEEDLRVSANLLQELAKFLLNPKINKLKQLNKLLCSLPPATTAPKLRLWEKYPSLRHIMALMGCVSSGVAVSFLCMKCLPITTDTAVYSGINVSIGLISAYAIITARKKT